MAKQIKIKDIANMAGVSAGTVDRILHNRGNVSAKSREAVEKVLRTVGYKYNLHTSAVSLTKEFTIVITTPLSTSGDYWWSVLNGIEQALKEYSDIEIRPIYSYYNQFDVYSCRTSFAGVADWNPDAVIIGPTFIDETVGLCRRLDEAKIPYIFVDGIVEGTHPIATFSTDQHMSGYLLGRMLCSITPPDRSLALFETRRIGNQLSSNSITRREGFLDCLAKTGRDARLLEASFSVMNPDENQKTAEAFFRAHPDVGGVAVMNSRGYLIAELLEREHLDHIRMICFDLTAHNDRFLESGTITALLCQRPELQGYQALITAIRYLLYRQEEKVVHHMLPIDVIFKENRPYYRDFFGI